MKKANMNYNDDHLQIQAQECMVTLDGHPLLLTRKELVLLATLAANEGEIVNRRDLLREVWGYGENVKTRTLDVHIRRLRKKLGGFGDSYIETVFGIGYRFQRSRTAPPFRAYYTEMAMSA